MIHQPIKPMLLHKSDHVPEGDYLYQLKYDGHRCLLSFDLESGTQLYTRRQTNCTVQYPEITEVNLNAKHAVLDGEMIVLDEGKPCFDSVMTRFRTRNPYTIERQRHSLPAQFIVFDVLYYNGKSLLHTPLEERLAILSEIIPETKVISTAKIFDDGHRLFEAAVKMDLEGIVAKKKGSLYELDKRSQAWVKVKHYHYDVVDIAGIRKGEFAWLLQQDGRYVGTCEFVPPKERQAFYHISKQLVTEENDKWIYLAPKVKCQVKFQNYTKKGLMRTPSFVQFELTG
ncbi:RNA ligase family protein [Caldalkalibacillus salinus]|uniref:ATP-dependent DNA ligase n=1 Tax=Caldalkalibacillus salinus TaxID=2803787 RepID=UPI001920C98D|nr:RNA ligase family protein [Caldalkalibacillus salinus]